MPLGCGSFKMFRPGCEYLAKFFEIKDLLNAIPWP